MKILRILFAFLILTFGITAQAADIPEPFNDVQEGHKNFEAVDFMRQSGMVRGYSNGSFQAENKINRAEFLKIVLEAQNDFSGPEAQGCADALNLLGEDTIYFDDVEKEQWFAPYVCYAVQNKIVKGCNDGTFRPTDEINLAEMAKIVVLTQKLELGAAKSGEEWFMPYLRSLETKNVIPTSITGFGHKMNRGEMAEVLYRIVEKKSDKESLTIEEIAGAIPNGAYECEEGDNGDCRLPSVKNCSLLSTILKDSSEYGNQNTMMKNMSGFGVDLEEMAEEEVMMDDIAAPTASTAESDGGASDFSETNVQVQGVDEADIVKNDGKYIYLIKGNTVRIIEAYPSKNLEQVAVFAVPDENFNPQELFLNDDQLIIIGSSWRQEKAELYEDQGFSLKRLMAPAAEIGIWYPYWSTNLTRVYVVDITDRKKPEIERTVSYEGNLSKSRRIGDIAYLVMNKRPNYQILRGAPEDDQRYIIPLVEDSAVEEGKAQPVCDCGDVDYFPGYESPNYLIVAAIPLDNPNTPAKQEVFLGSSENIYMSKNALYVATGYREPGAQYWSWDNTQIYKFKLDGLKVEFVATNKVPGRILNQFSMDEHKGNFRIATTKGEVWNEKNTSTNRLYILDEKLEQMGAIEDIAPGERIYSVRFMGDRAFMVTFKTVDPLFVIDTSDPKNPQILGELKIPGWSDYLHPYDENHLIGFGKEVDASIDVDKVHSDNAIYYTAVQGMKVSIFDVTDLSNPKETHKIVFGDRGTESEILNDHKALLFDKKRGLLAFPIQIQKKVEPKELQCTRNTYSSCPSGCQKRCIPSSCIQGVDGVILCTEDCDGLGSCMNPDYDRFKTTFAGAMILDIDLEDGFTERGRISGHTEKEYDQDYFYPQWEKKIRRILRMDETLYTVSQSEVKAVDLNAGIGRDLSVQNSVNLDEGTAHCPKYIDRMPKVLPDGAEPEPFEEVPEGCDGITEIVY